MTWLAKNFGLLLAGIVFIVLLGYEAFVWRGDASLVAVLSYAFGLVVVLGAWSYADIPLHHPLAIVFGNILVGVSIRGLLIRYRSADPEIQEIFIRDASMADFAGTLVLLLMLVPVFLLGYNLVGSREWSVPVISSWTWSERRYHVLEILYLVLSVAGVVSFVQKMGLIGVIQTIYDLSSKRHFTSDGQALALGYQRMAALSSVVLYYVTVIRVLSRRAQGERIAKRDRFRMVVYFMLASTLPFITSNRSIIMFTLVNTVLLISLFGRFNLRSFLSYGLIGLLIFNTMSLLRNERLLAGDDEEFSLSESLKPLLENRNLFDLSKTTHILNAVPQSVPFQHGSTFTTVLYAPIPRSIWPEKPEINVGRLIATDVYGVGYHLRTGIPPGLIGEFYLNFGYPGVVFAALFYGAVVRLLWNLIQAGPSRASPNQTLVYIVCVLPVSITLLGSSLQQTLVTLLQFAGLIALAAFILREAPRPPSGNRHA